MSVVNNQEEYEFALGLLVMSVMEKTSKNVLEEEALKIVKEKWGWQG